MQAYAHHHSLAEHLDLIDSLAHYIAMTVPEPRIRKDIRLFRIAASEDEKGGDSIGATMFYYIADTLENGLEEHKQEEAERVRTMIEETTVRLRRSEIIEVEVTDALEFIVFQTLDDHTDDGDSLRQRYAAMDDKGKARWLAEMAIHLGLEKFLCYDDTQLSFLDD